MNQQTLLELLAEVERGALTPKQASARLANLPFEESPPTPDATRRVRIDHHRILRTGLPEVIYAAGKTPEQTAAIFSPHGRRRLRRPRHPRRPRRDRRGRPRTAPRRHATTPRPAPSPSASLPRADTRGHIAVLCAGTSDLPVAEEAAVTAELFNARVTRLYDVGVAGLHRLLAVRAQLADANAVIVCAGMEGALPSVVGGLVAVPVIAVPTSVGYGASFAGAAALLGMLNSCSPNVTVVNIDNGFGAAYTATLIARASHRP